MPVIKKPIPPKEYLLFYLKYLPEEGCPETGFFRWHHAPNDSVTNKWAGRISPSNYRRITIEGHIYSEHRLVYFIEHGVEPDLIDHIDGNKLNNRIENLRNVNAKINAVNWVRKNKTGFRGVSFRADRNSRKFGASIGLGKKRIHLGFYDTAEEAALAFDKKAKEFFPGYAVLNFPEV